MAIGDEMIDGSGPESAPCMCCGAHGYRLRKRIHELEDQLRARKIEVNSAALSDAHKRVRELETHLLLMLELVKDLRDENAYLRRVCE